MITRKDLSDVYDWASHRKFPMKGNPSSPNYTNKKIYSCQLKFVRKNVNIRKSLMNDRTVSYTHLTLPTILRV